MNFEPAQEEEALRAQLREVVENASPAELQTLAEQWKTLGDRDADSAGRKIEVPASLKEPSPEELERQLRERRKIAAEPVDHQVMHEKILKGFREV